MQPQVVEVAGGVPVQMPVAQCAVVAAPVAAAQPQPYDPRDDPEFEANKCCGCPPPLKGLAVAQLIVEIVCIIVGFISIFVVGLLGILQILAGVLGVTVAGMVLCKCKCCSPAGELYGYIAVVSVQLVVSVIDCIVYGALEAWAILAGAFIIGGFRVLCLVGAALTIEKSKKAIASKGSTPV